MDLVKLITSQLSDEVLGKLSSLVGADPETTRRAATATVPALLAGLSGIASNEDGARKLSSLLGNLDPGELGDLGNVARIAGGEASTLVQKGSGLLSSLMGDNMVAGIAGAVARYAGLDSSAARKLLGALAPSILGVIASQWKNMGGSVSALMNLFAEQKKNIAAAVPPGLSLASIPGLSHADEAMRTAGQTVRATADTVRRDYRTTDDSQLLKWLLPLAAGLLLAAALWYFTRRRPAEENVAVNPAPAVTGERTVQRPVLPEPQVTREGATIPQQLTNAVSGLRQILERIQDAASAQAVLPSFRELNGRFDTIRDQLGQLATDARSEVNRIVAEQSDAIRDQAQRIANLPGVSDEMKSEVDAIATKLQGLGAAQDSRSAP
jgi:hypothetical protein